MLKKKMLIALGVAAVLSVSCVSVTVWAEENAEEQTEEAEDSSNSEGEEDAKTGRMMMVPVEGTEEEIPADLVLIAAGFLGSQKYLTDANKVATTARTNVETKPEAYETSVPRVFTAGDMHRGQSLVVWAIREGREAAKAVDESLMGYSYL